MLKLFFRSHFLCSKRLHLLFRGILTSKLENKIKLSHLYITSACNWLIYSWWNNPELITFFTNLSSEPTPSKKLMNFLRVRLYLSLKSCVDQSSEILWKVLKFSLLLLRLIQSISSSFARFGMEEVVKAKEAASIEVPTIPPSAFYGHKNESEKNGKKSRGI